MGGPLRVMETELLKPMKYEDGLMRGEGPSVLKGRFGNFII